MLIAAPTFSPTERWWIEKEPLDCAAHAGQLLQVYEDSESEVFRVAALGGPTGSWDLVYEMPYIGTNVGGNRAPGGFAIGENDVLFGARRNRRRAQPLASTALSIGLRNHQNHLVTCIN